MYRTTLQSITEPLSNTLDSIHHSAATSRISSYVISDGSASFNARNRSTPSRLQASRIFSSLSSAIHSGRNSTSPRSTISETIDTTLASCRPRARAISPSVRPSASNVSVSSAGDTATFLLAASRSPSSNRLNSAKISAPYFSTFFSPNPITLINCSAFAGRTRHNASIELSFITIYAGIPNSFAFLLLHARKCSRSSGSTPVAASSSANSRNFRPSSPARPEPTEPEAPAPAAAAIPRLFFDRLPIGAATGSANHDGVTPHTSHALHRSHFGLSPKCEQIRKWRHSTSSTNRRTVL